MAEIKMPEAGFSVPEGTVIKWYKKVGDPVEEGENLVSVETDKITLDIPAECSGVLKEIRYHSGEVVATGNVIGIIEEGKAAEADVENAARRISPAARAEAKARGIDLALISVGSGPGGRIVKQDILDYDCKAPVATDGAADRTIVSDVSTTILPVSRPEPKEVGEQRVEFIGWRKTIAERMLESFRGIPHYTMSVEADVTELTGLIGRQREKNLKLHLTYLPFMMKALIAGILGVPSINSLADGDGYTIYKTVNIGVAVDLGEKLLVPVVKDVQAKSILELADELGELVSRARADHLEPRDVEGGTITLTNVGMYHTVGASSIILSPQVAIVYMGTAREIPAVWEGKIEVRRRMVFGGTFDHRVVNGAAGGRFLARIKDFLEDSNGLCELENPKRGVEN
jgi:2-oxoglutarate dehydrogenase E2 component (dihydrolipoamide succinyltransferase)